MKKIFMAIVMFVMAISTCHAETPANVCDFDVYQFCKNYNNMLQLVGWSENSCIDKTRMVTLPRGNDNTVYLLPLKSYNKGKGTSMAISVDKSGNITTIAINNNKKSDHEYFGNAAAVTMVLIGFDMDNIKDVKNDLKLIFSDNKSRQYVDAIDRYIEIEFVGDKVRSDGVGSVLFTASED